MLAGLDRDALVGGDDEQDGVHVRRAGDHGLDELLVAGDVDEDDLLLVFGDVEEDESQLDRHPPLFFLGQGVGVDPGQGLDEGALAVVDVAGRADDDMALVAHGARTAAIASSTRRSSSGWIVRKSNRTASRLMREKTAGRRSRRVRAISSGPEGAPETARHFVGIVSTGTDAAPDLRALVDDGKTDGLGEAFAKAALDAPGAFLELFGLERQHPVERMRLGEGIGIEEELERRLHRGDRQLAAAEGAGERVLLDSGDGVGLTDDEARLRAADELVAAEAGDGDARLDAPPDERLGFEAEGAKVDQGAASEVVDDGNARLPAELGELLDPGLGRESEDAVVAVVDAEDGAGVRADRRLVVPEVRLVGRPDLAHDGSARGHDVRHAERSADLDELSARNDDFLAQGQRVEDEHRPGGVVVADRRRFGPGELGQQAADVRVALAAAAGLEIEGERAVSPRDVVEGGPAGLGEDGPAESRMHEDARGVDRFFEAGVGHLGEPALRRGRERLPGRERLRPRPPRDPSRRRSPPGARRAPPGKPE